MNDAFVEKFKNIFEGLSIAYGQYQKGDHDENGKHALQQRQNIALQILVKRRKMQVWQKLFICARRLRVEKAIPGSAK